MGGREGIIDTACKTAETGYIQRKLVKGMEDVKIHHDYSVRNANNNIIQFLYGEDGIDPTKIEKQSLPIITMDISEIESTYRIRIQDYKSHMDKTSFTKLVNTYNQSDSYQKV